MLGERPTKLLGHAWSAKMASLAMHGKQWQLPWSCKVSKNGKIQQIHNVARRKAAPNMANLAMHGKQSLLLTYKLIINEGQQQEYIKDKQRRKKQSKLSQQTRRTYAVLPRGLTLSEMKDTKVPLSNLSTLGALRRAGP